MIEDDDDRNEPSERRQAEIAAAAADDIKAVRDVIRRRIEDVVAHVATDPDPNSPATVARSSVRSATTSALARLDELASALADRSGDRIDGLIGKSWEGAFRRSWDAARATSDPADLRPEDTPTAAMIDRARSIILGGLDGRTIIDGPIDRAKDSLRAIVRTSHASRSVWRGWSRRTIHEIEQAAALAIYTGAYRQDARAVRLVFKPELIGPDPTDIDS